MQSELRHHGILGQKWGVRRYQNPDGTLTALGKRHRQESFEARMLADDIYKKAEAKIEEMKHRIQYLESDKAMMQGEINGLRFAIRCNGVSGGEVG